jgi:hypothetical protein
MCVWRAKGLWVDTVYNSAWVVCLSAPGRSVFAGAQRCAFGGLLRTCRVLVCTESRFLLAAGISGIAPCSVSGLACCWYRWRFVVHVKLHAGSIAQQLRINGNMCSLLFAHAKPHAVHALVLHAVLLVCTACSGRHMQWALVGGPAGLNEQHT